MVKSSARSSARNQQDQYVLKASVNDVRMLAGMLRPISVSPQATFRISKLGLEVSTEAHRAVVAKAWIMNDLFTHYSYNPPGSHRRKKKRTKHSESKGKDRQVSVSGSGSSDARFDEFLNRDSNDDPTSSDVVKAVFGPSSEMSGDSIPMGKRNAQESFLQEEEEEEEQEEENIDQDENDLEVLATSSMETDLNLNHLIECLDIFGGAPALKGPTKSESSAGGGKEKEDDAITEEFRRRARERKESNGRESPERRYDSGGKASRDDKDRTALRMSWQGHGHPFVLLLEEQNVVTRCELSTIETYEIRDLGFSSTEDVAKAIINSEWLQSAFSSIDPSATSLSILFSPSYRPLSTLSTGMVNGFNENETIDDTTMIQDQDDGWMHENEGKKIKGKKKGAKKNKPVQMLRLSADGDFGSSVIELPVDPAVVFEFNCLHETENKYNFNHLSHLLKALSASTKVAIRVNEIGVAVFQFLMPRGTAGSGPGSGSGSGSGSNEAAGNDRDDGRCGFVDFYILPLQQIELQDQDEASETD